MSQKCSRLSLNSISVGTVIDFSTLVTFIPKFCNTDTERETESLSNSCWLVGRAGASKEMHSYL